MTEAAPEHDGTFRAFPNEALAWLGTGPIPTAPYHRPEYFELEREAVFRRVWLHAGRVSEVAEPGDYFVRDYPAARASVLVVRGNDGEIRAFHNACAHRGTELLWDDDGRVDAFTCHYHRWRYDLDGSLQGVPDLEHFYDLDLAACGLKPVAVDVCGGFVFVHLAAEPAHTLREFLGGFGDRLETSVAAHCDHFSEFVVENEANWKTHFDNFQELYLLRWAHAPSRGGRSTSPQNPFGYGSRYDFDGLHRSMTLWWDTTAPPVAAPPVEEFVGQALRTSAGDLECPPGTGEFMGLFPNLFYLDTRFYCLTQEVVPLSVGRTRGITRMYWKGDDERASVRLAREYVTAALMDVHCEDRALVQAAQRGLDTGAIEHVQLQSQEALLRHLFQGVDGLVQQYLAEQGPSGGRS